jgi:enoyl-CoA hydratase/carnithine racemase
MVLCPDLDLRLSESGDPLCPVIFADPGDGAPRGSLPVVVGVLRGTEPPPAALEEFALTLTEGPAYAPQLVRVPNLGAAIEQLREAVDRSPRAALACIHLLRYAADSTLAGLAAEAAAFSMLLGGPEFARWLEDRGPARPSPAQNRPLVRIRRHDGELAITLNHPRRRNALSGQLRAELLAAVEVAAADPSITRVNIDGAGPGFCSGGDLSEFGLARDPTSAYLVRLTHAPWRIIDSISERVTMRVHGACVGAGAEIAAFGGQVIAAPDTFFSFPEVSMGLVPGAGGTVSVPRRIGRWRAAWLFLTGERLTAAAALDWGLVDEIGPGNVA